MKHTGPRCWAPRPEVQLLVSLTENRRHPYNLCQRPGLPTSSHYSAGQKHARQYGLGWGAAGPGREAVRSPASGSEVAPSVVHLVGHQQAWKLRPGLQLRTAHPLLAVRQSSADTDRGPVRSQTTEVQREEPWLMQ